MAARRKDDVPGDAPVEEQARQQTGQQQIRMRIDERDMESCYANAFRTNGTAEEVILDFGLNILVPTGPQQQPDAPPQPADAAEPGQQTQGEILFNVKQRVILNYYSAKRLAITLSQLIRRHEEQFGELEMDVNKRRKDQS